MLKRVLLGGLVGALLGTTVLYAMSRINTEKTAPVPTTVIRGEIGDPLSRISAEDAKFDPSQFGVFHFLIGERQIAVVISVYKGQVVNVSFIPHAFVQENGCHEPVQEQEPEEDSLDDSN